MKTFLLMLLMLGGAFWFWNYNEGNKGTSLGWFDSLFPEQEESGYVVKKGDTLSSIARAHGLSVQQIKQWNKLSSDTIHVNQQLELNGQKSVAKSESSYVGPLPSKSSTAESETPKPKPQKPITKKQLPKSTVMESGEVAIDINDKNQVYLKTNDGKYKPAGVIIYGSDADKNGNEVKTITYRDLKGKETTLSGANTPDAVIRKALSKR